MKCETETEQRDTPHRPNEAFEVHTNRTPTMKYETETEQRDTPHRPNEAFEVHKHMATTKTKKET